MLVAGRLVVKSRAVAAPDMGMAWNQSSFGTAAQVRTQTSHPTYIRILFHQHCDQSPTFNSLHLKYSDGFSFFFSGHILASWLICRSLYARLFAEENWRRKLNLRCNFATCGLELSVWYLDSSVLRLSEMKDYFRLVSWSCFDLWI